MKLTIRALILGICAIGASAAVSTTHSATAAMTVSHQAASSAMPIPNCNPSGCSK